MAAELETLIQTYRARGLTEAADFLAVGKEGLQAKELLPLLLDPEVDFSLTGRVNLRRERRLHLGDTYEIDTLNLRVRTRNALLKAGVSTIAELTFLLQHDLLPQLRDIGEVSRHEIAERLRRDAT